MRLGDEHSSLIEGKEGPRSPPHRPALDPRARAERMANARRGRLNYLVSSESD